MDLNSQNLNNQDVNTNMNENSDITFDKLKNESLSSMVCNEVIELLQEFQSKEAEYIYSSYNKRKLFTLEDKNDFIRNHVNLSVDEYIKKFQLQDKYNRNELKESLSNTQSRNFKNSNMTINEFIGESNIRLSYRQNELLSDINYFKEKLHMEEYLYGSENIDDVDNYYDGDYDYNENPEDGWD